MKIKLSKKFIRWALLCLGLFLVGFIAAKFLTTTQAIEGKGGGSSGGGGFSTTIEKGGGNFTIILVLLVLVVGVVAYGY
ncbi:MAG: hypothetical protein GY950_05835 [bacterium]|nr:hypothetical protein [bacterium]